MQHSLNSSKYAVLRFEDPDAVARLKADAIEAYKPVNSQELIAVERIALAQHEIFRAAQIETGLLTAALDEVFDIRDACAITALSPVTVRDERITSTQNVTYSMGLAFRRVARESDAWTMVLRFQTLAERQYRRAIEEFERVRKIRPGMPYDPDIAAKQPAAPDCPATARELNSPVSDA